MIAQKESKLARWGNSQGVIIPKRLCESIGLRVGDPVTLTVNDRTGSIELMPCALLNDMPNRRVI